MSLARTAAVLALAAIAHAATAQHRFELDNGAAVIVMPVAGIDRVGVESIYDIGFVDEPAGLTQAAHLAEHLMCMGALGDLDRGEAWNTLNDLGMANAETLATLTHYDAMAGSDDLEAVLEIEAARLRGVSVDRDIIDHEAGRCCAEAINLQRSAQAPLHKFALMAALQGWAHDRDEASVTSGLADSKIEDVDAFLSTRYVASRLTLVIVGGVDPDGVRALATSTIGEVAAPPAPAARPAIDWAAQPRDRTIRWGSTVPAVFVGVAPPDDAVSCLVQSLWGALLAQRLQADAAIADLTRSVGTSAHIVPVGPLPFHAFGTLREGADADDAVARLGAAIERHAKEATPADAAQIRAFAGALRTTRPLTLPMIESQARSLGASGYDRDRAIGLILGNAALQAGIGNHLVDLFGADAFDRLGVLDDARILLISRETADPGRRFVTRLVPRSP